jgi:hypothetical protein
VVVYGSKDSGIGNDLVRAFFQDEMLDASARPVLPTRDDCVHACIRGQGAESQVPDFAALMALIAETEST